MTNITELKSLCLGTRCTSYQYENGNFRCALSKNWVLEGYDVCTKKSQRELVADIPLERQTRGRYSPTAEFD